MADEDIVIHRVQYPHLVKREKYTEIVEDAIRICNSIHVKGSGHALIVQLLQIANDLAGDLQETPDSL